MKARVVKIGLVQTSVGPDKAKNLEKTAALASDLAKRGAEIICLQELFASEYFCQVEDAELFDLAEPLNGPTTQAMAAVAKAGRCSIVVPLFERRAAGVYHNSLVVLGPNGETLGHYRKMHIPDDPLFYEKFYFTPGDLGFMSIPTPQASLGPLICWDQWYPEAARLTALRGGGTRDPCRRPRRVRAALP
jgi:N-carbamoylputrescine amidase